MTNIEKRILVIFSIIYFVGALGFIIPTLRPYFVPLTPLTILASLIAALAFEKKIELKRISVLLAIGIAGFFVEYAGVKTGKIFGVYEYGDTLGPGWRSIPFLIGINWMAIIYFTNGISSFLVKNKILASVGAAFLAVFYDFFLEPVAMKFGFWNWEMSTVPLQNYLAWFSLSFIFSVIYQYNYKYTKNPLARGIFIIQLLFFAAIFLYLRF